MKNRKEELIYIICREKRKSGYLAIIAIILLFASVMLISVSATISILSAILATLSIFFIDSIQDQKKLDDAFHELRDLED